jgi:hypothetical protein
MLSQLVHDVCKIRPDQVVQNEIGFTGEFVELRECPNFPELVLFLFGFLQQSCSLRMPDSRT